MKESENQPKARDAPKPLDDAGGSAAASPAQQQAGIFLIFPCVSVTFQSSAEADSCHNAVTQVSRDSLLLLDLPMGKPNSCLGQQSCAVGMS